MGKWVNDRLDQLAKIHNGTDYKQNPKGVSIPIYGTGGIMGFTSVPLNSGPAILTGRKGTIDRPMYVKGDFWHVDTVFCIKANDKIDAKYLFYSFTNRDLSRLNEATGVPSVTSTSLYHQEFQYPVSLAEQRHIAEILTTCDEVIEKSEAVVEKYRAIKAGMLKDLFTRGIGKNGKLRPPPESAPQLYKDTALGKVPCEWEVKRLGSVCFPPQYGLNVAAVKYDGKHGYLRITDIDDESHLFIRQGITSPSMYEEIYRAQEGDVFFARTGASTGKTYLYRAEDGELYFAGFLIKFHCKERVNSAYVFYQTVTTRYLNWVSAVSTRTGQPGINSQELSTFRMAIPSDPAEQRQIAERLSAIDAKIADELAVIAKYRKVKTGLMARLLTPPPDVEIVDGGVE